MSWEMLTCLRTLQQVALKGCQQPPWLDELFSKDHNTS